MKICSKIGAKRKALFTSKWVTLMLNSAAIANMVRYVENFKVGA